jgi:hypothetical protein
MVPRGQEGQSLSPEGPGAKAPLDAPGGDPEHDALQAQTFLAAASYLCVHGLRGRPTGMEQDERGTHVAALERARVSA